jgi:hypothetical protein
MKKGWIVVCTCTLAFVSVAGFAQTPNVVPLTSEALAAILGPSAVTPAPSCAALRGEPIFAANAKKPRPGGEPKSICNATASCGSGSVSCSGNSTCWAVDRDCLNCEQGHVTCDGVTKWCSSACNCNSYFGVERWCCQCACTADCVACCRCDGGGAGQCAFQCG